MDRVALKQAAKNQIKGKIGVLFVITLIIGVISGVASFVLQFVPFGSYVGSIIITPAFSLSLVRVYLNVIAGKQVGANDAFSGFDDFWSAFKVTFLTGLFTFLWSLLFIIPGIIKSLEYSMAMYILAENKGKSARECINESKAMMQKQGRVLDLFVLSLSFIGWALLCVVTFGIACIWVGPYIQATYANVYQSFKPVKLDAEQAAEQEA